MIYNGKKTISLIEGKDYKGMETKEDYLDLIIWTDPKHSNLLGLNFHNYNRSKQ